VNPLRHLLAPNRVLTSPPAAAQQTITGREFFPDLISGPFHQGLAVAFAVAAALSAVAVLASLLGGGRYVRPAAANAPREPAEALPMGGPEGRGRRRSEHGRAGRRAIPGHVR
jgi:hypothetical protein